MHRLIGAILDYLPYVFVLSFDFQGYTGSDEGVELPADHPPVPGHMQPSTDAKEFTVKREEVPDDSRLFVNARVWTGDPQVCMALWQPGLSSTLCLPNGSTTCFHRASA